MNYYFLTDFQRPLLLKIAVVIYQCCARMHARYDMLEGLGPGMGMSYAHGTLKFVQSHMSGPFFCIVCP